MTSWASCSSWEPPQRPDSRRKPAPPNRPGLLDTFCTARPYRKWAGLLVHNRYFWFKMDFWCKALLSLELGLRQAWPEVMRVVLQECSNCTLTNEQLLTVGGDHILPIDQYPVSAIATADYIFRGGAVDRRCNVGTVPSKELVDRRVVVRTVR